MCRLTLLALAITLAACHRNVTSSPTDIQATGTSKQFVFGALGDSISVGYDINTLFQEDLPESWTTGSLLSASHYNQIKSILAQNGSNTTDVVLNLAIPGDTVLGAGSQFLTNTQLLAENLPNYVTIEIGANDVCQGNLSSVSSVSGFQTQIEAAIQILTSSAAPPKAIVIVSIPNIWQLTQIPGLATATITYNGASLTCQDVWNVVCPNMAVGKTTFTAQWTSANQAIAAAAQSFGSFVTYDGGAVAAATFANEDVSAVDCFHPSIAGQTKIATTVWNAVASEVTANILAEKRSF